MRYRERLPHHPGLRLPGSAGGRERGAADVPGRSPSAAERADSLRFWRLSEFAKLSFEEIAERSFEAA